MGRNLNKDIVSANLNMSTGGAIPCFSYGVLEMILLLSILSILLLRKILVSILMSSIMCVQCCNLVCKMKIPIHIIMASIMCIHPSMQEKKKS